MFAHSTKGKGIVITIVTVGLCQMGIKTTENQKNECILRMYSFCHNSVLVNIVVFS